MNKILVLYRSKYGSSKKYAHMLQEELSCDIFEASSYSFENAAAYDLIIACGGIYAGGISVMKYIRKNAAFLKSRKVIVLAVGASPFDSKAFEAVREQNLKGLPFPVAMFYGRGAYDESVMDFKDKTLCRLLKKALQKRKPDILEPWMEAFLEADGKSCDWTAKSHLEPLLKYIRSI